MTDILIGVGGTGAKIVEAAMMLFAAGLGPRRVHVGLVDQDSSNGNVARTKDLIATYRTVREQWQSQSKSSAIDWNSIDFCRTEVVELFGRDNPIWVPGGDTSTIRQLIGQNLDPARQDLLDLLFTPGGDEQDLVLGEGYRGRAHVGAAALISRLSDPSNPLSTKVGELMAGGGGREQVRVFVAGSVFGGTGAAGFPTIARELHRIRTDKDFTNKGRVAIGGALMLPYFGFASPDADERSRVVTTDELLPKTQLALEHYDTLFETESAFDRFYLVGWDRFFQLGYHKAGNEGQRNPPLLPELFAAAAAVEFTRTDEATLARSGAADRIRVSARHERQVTWSDFPLLENEMRDKLGQLIRFALYWRHTVADLTEERRPWIGKGNWTQQLDGKASKQDAENGVRALGDLLDRVLLFAAAIEDRSPGDWERTPWRLAPLRDSDHQPTPTEPVRLIDRHPGAHDIFSQLIRTDEGTPVSRDAAAVYNDLETAASSFVRGEHKGLGRVVAAAYNAAGVSGGQS